MIDPERPAEDHQIMLPDEVDMQLYHNDWDEACQYENMLEHIARVFDE